MGSYLSPALWVRPRVPGLGHVPVHPLAALCFGILGFANPLIWLVGFGAQALAVVALASNARFQRVVDAQRLVTGEEEQQKRLRSSLRREGRELMRKLDTKCRKVREIERKNPSDLGLARSNDQALGRLAWLYLKLLVARDLLGSPDVQVDEDDVRRQVAELEQSLADAGTSETVRESHEATLRILRQRLDALEHREQTLAQIQADLTRIEAQVDLVLESSALEGRPQVVSASIDLAADLLDTAVYGDQADAIHDLDVLYGVTGAAASAEG